MAAQKAVMLFSVTHLEAQEYQFFSTTLKSGMLGKQVQRNENN